MKKSALVFILNILLLQGCGGDNASTQTEQTPPTPPANTTQQPPTPENTNKGGETVATNSDILGSSDNVATIQHSVASGLIPSVNPKLRQQQVIKGKNDPFALLVVKPPIPPSLTLKPVKNQGTLNTIKPIRGNVSSQSNCKGSNCLVNSITGTNTGGTNLSEPPKPPKPPKPPEPLEAKSVLVSGILNVDGKKVAIVKTSQYDYSYSIEEGSILYGGQVLVRGINVTPENPFIVLEQYGQKIVRKVGQPIETPTPKSDPKSNNSSKLTGNIQSQ